LNNVPGMISFLQSRLPEKLLRVEDAQILYGDGNTPNLKGIGTSGNYTAATTTETELALAIIDGIAQLEDVNERYATGVLVRPKAYYNFFKHQVADSGVFDLPKNFVFVNGTLYVSGIPVYASTAVTTGDYFIGDWDMGADLLIQEAMRIEFFEQDGTNVRENKITVRIEETVALPVYGSDYFIKGSDADQS
jgi:HK97 family phage major capsid protein